MGVWRGTSMMCNGSGSSEDGLRWFLLASGFWKGIICAVKLKSWKSGGLLGHLKEVEGAILERLKGTYKGGRAILIRCNGPGSSKDGQRWILWPPGFVKGIICRAELKPCSLGDLRGRFKEAEGDISLKLFQGSLRGNLREVWRGTIMRCNGPWSS